MLYSTSDLGLKSAGMVESIREIKGVQSIERRYDLSSLMGSQLPPAPPQFLDAPAL
jgi:hypothetical protein